MVVMMRSCVLLSLLVLVLLCISVPTAAHKRHARPAPAEPEVDDDDRWEMMRGVEVEDARDGEPDGDEVRFISDAVVRRSSSSGGGFVPPQPPAPSTSTPITPISPPGIGQFATAIVTPAIDRVALRLMLPDVISLQSNFSYGGLSEQRHWTLADVDATLRAAVGSDAYTKQQNQLGCYMASLNKQIAKAQARINTTGRSHEDDDDHHHGDHDSRYSAADLSSFYLRHAQCRACVGFNELLLLSTAATVDNALPSYQPAAVMKWCSLVTPRMSCESAPSSANPFPLHDSEGYCVPVASPCPATSVDLNILSDGLCNGDEAAGKLSCPLCVNDGYSWLTNKRALKSGDNYAGQCYDTRTVLPLSASQYSRAVLTLDSCPSSVYSDWQQRHFYKAASGFSLLVVLVVLCCLCMAVRRCCVARRSARLARLSAATASSAFAVPLPVAEPVLAQSRSQPRPSAPAAEPSVYPAFAQQRPAASSASQLQQPLLYSNSGLNPPFYPHLSGTPPAYYSRV